MKLSVNGAEVFAATGGREFDSSLPYGVFTEIIPYSREIALGGISLLAIAGVVAIAMRRMRM